MARPKKNAEEGEVKANIEGLEALTVEFRKARMPERKLNALRTKLVSLFKQDIITSDEQELMEAILRKDRIKGQIQGEHDHILNGIEIERTEGECIVKTDDVPTVHHLKKHMKCRYVFDPEFNNGKGRKDSIGRYYVYVPRVIPVTHQLTEDIVRREERGHPIAREEYPEPKTRIHRVSLSVPEFSRWFEVEDDEVLKPKEEEYKF